MQVDYFNYERWIFQILGCAWEDCFIQFYSTVKFNEYISNQLQISEDNKLFKLQKFEQGNFSRDHW